MGARLGWIAFVLAWSSLWCRPQGTDYYISSGGDDSANGSRGKPWKSISRLNCEQLGPGDRVFFEGGRTFTGTILLDAGDEGIAGWKVDTAWKNS